MHTLDLVHKAASRRFVSRDRPVEVYRDDERSIGGKGESKWFTGTHDCTLTEAVVERPETKAAVVATGRCHFC